MYGQKLAILYITKKNSSQIQKKKQYTQKNVTAQNSHNPKYYSIHIIQKQQSAATAVRQTISQ